MFDSGARSPLVDHRLTSVIAMATAKAVTAIGQQDPHTAIRSDLFRGGLEQGLVQRFESVLVKLRCQRDSRKWFVFADFAKKRHQLGPVPELLSNGFVSRSSTPIGNLFTFTREPRAGQNIEKRHQQQR
jgi:hypothetical protein